MTDSLPLVRVLPEKNKLSVSNVMHILATRRFALLRLHVLRPLRSGQLQNAGLKFGLEWELSAIAITNATGVNDGGVMHAVSTDKSESFAEIGKVKFTKDDPQLAGCSDTLELITAPLSLSEFSEMDRSLRSSIDALK